MTSKRFLAFAFSILLASMPAKAAERLSVVTSIPDLAWVAAEIGGELVDAKSLLRGTENPHFVDAVPEFTRLVANADVVCIVGLDLEVGYMPPVLARSGNAQVQPGGKGYCEAGKTVSVLERPIGPVDRSMGDVHPHGNPHFYLSPKALAEGAEVIAETLTAVDPGHAAQYQKGLAAFAASMKALGDDIGARLKPLRDAQEAAGKALIMENHREFTYFLEQYRLKSFGSVEEKPGVPPSAGRLGTLATSAKAAGVRVVLAADDGVHLADAADLRRLDPEPDQSGLLQEKAATTGDGERRRRPRSRGAQPHRQQRQPVDAGRLRLLGRGRASWHELGKGAAQTKPQADTT